MPARTAPDLEQLLETMEKRGTPPESKSLEQVAEEIGKAMGVQPDEVAILQLSPSGKALNFVLPERLRGVGSIPLTSTTALAAKTARERRSDIVNSFAVARHASVFEGIPLGKGPAEAIHKIMSAPILNGDQVIGVVQISRKGRSAAEAGADFTSKDLHELQGLNHALGRLLALCPS